MSERSTSPPNSHLTNAEGLEDDVGTGGGALAGDGSASTGGDVGVPNDAPPTPEGLGADEIRAQLVEEILAVAAEMECVGVVVVFASPPS